MKTWLWQENDVMVMKPLSDSEVQVITHIFELTTAFDPLFPKNAVDLLTNVNPIGISGNNEHG